MLIVFDLDDTLYDKTGQVDEHSQWQDVEKIVPLPGVKGFLNSFSGKKILLTKETEHGLQTKKIEALGIKKFFDKVIICHSDDEKKALLEKIKQDFPNEEIWVVGDRIDTEIRFGKELGLKTIRLKHGKYKDLTPKNKYEVPDYEIASFRELKKVLGQ
mgnify:FL=1